MVDPGEFVPTTLQREFSEEALSIERMNQEEKNEISNKLKDLFHKGKVVSNFDKYKEKVSIVLWLVCWNAISK